MMTNPMQRLTQGQFSFLPDLSDAEITAQIEYGLAKGYAWSVEYTDEFGEWWEEPRRFRAGGYQRNS